VDDILWMIMLVNNYLISLFLGRVAPRDFTLGISVFVFSYGEGKVEKIMNGLGMN